MDTNALLVALYLSILSLNTHSAPVTDDLPTTTINTTIPQSTTATINTTATNDEPTTALESTTISRMSFEPWTGLKSVRIFHHFTSLMTICTVNDTCKITTWYGSKFLVVHGDGKVTSTRNYHNASGIYMTTFNTAVQYRDKIHDYYIAVNETSGDIYARSRGGRRNTLWSERLHGAIYSPCTHYYISIQRNGDVIGVNSTERALNPRNSKFMKISA